ncbi:MAG: D-2-hydroxyacid dehydrogenase [Deltaproteobacteria bacterium]|nr:D-2-hydroxyacid dehydrogenase [Deltaproteobacteria bacterium]
MSWEPLAALGRLEVHERTPRTLVAVRLREATVALTGLASIGAGIFDQCPGLRYIGVLATGYDMVDVRTATERGVTVSNVPGYGTAAVSQQALALLLEICHNVGRYSQAVHEGGWVSSRGWCFGDHPLIELEGLTMGVVGLGRIGQAMARMARAMGMEVMADQEHPAAWPGPLADYVPLAELLASSDVICLSCPLGESNMEMINRETISGMKDGVIIINVARGGLVNDLALAQALESGKVRAAGLDVVSSEPLRPGDPLYGAKNCFITPHVAGTGRKSRQRLLDVAVSNLRHFLGGRPANLVNP